MKTRKLSLTSWSFGRAVRRFRSVKILKITRPSG
ncbi:hypothetical protein HMPREF9450_00231 [Alistipes indistinctus YIT 12060]|uniref:Uncharacterized protein n=1 Tax=Alistipes indistinctus YIT 12060 TaxID=742725 RepID=G5H5M1_9BACT|nr:hypothetical protein HMPREF9450_00231 [Alistipes indistinctus YIT 12060]